MSSQPGSLPLGARHRTVQVCGDLVDKDLRFAPTGVNPAAGEHNAARLPPVLDRPPHAAEDHQLDRALEVLDRPKAHRLAVSGLVRADVRGLARYADGLAVDGLPQLGALVRVDL